MTLPAIVEEFMEMVRLEVGSRHERTIADVMKLKLAALGFSVEEDGVGEVIGGDAGNIIARLKGDPSLPPVLFSAHLDRVDNHGKIQPEISPEGDAIRSDGTSILAADDVSGICAILYGVRKVLNEKNPHGDIEIVLSVAEEVGLLGARYLDYTKVKAKMAYVIDSGGPVGTITNEAPTQYSLVVKVHGRSAHAGMEPEKGLSAIRVAAVALTRLREGRLSDVTTSNFGTFHAGKVTNIVCDMAEIHGECRSRKSEELDSYRLEVKTVFAEVAREFNTEVELVENLEYQTFKVDESEPVIQIAVRALKNLGLTPEIRPGGGGMDGNYFNQNGIKAIGISPGYVGVHTSQEHQSIADLMKCGELVAAIIKESGR